MTKQQAFLGSKAIQCSESRGNQPNRYDWNRRGNVKAALNMRTADDQRGKDKLKQANRAKRKAAKKQRRKNR